MAGEKTKTKTKDAEPTTKDATPATVIATPTAAAPPARITQAAHERLALGGFKDGLVRVDPEVQDDELLTDRPMFLLVGGLERKPPVEGGTIAKGMEVWHCMAEVSPGRWIPRTIRGRAHLSKCLMGQVHAHGLGFVDLATGELAHVPGTKGAFKIIDRATGAAAIVGAFVKIDRSKGRAAGKGQRFTYLVDGNGMILKRALELLPELPLTEKSALGIGLDDADGGDE